VCVHALVIAGFYLGGGRIKGGSGGCGYGINELCQIPGLSINAFLETDSIAGLKLLWSVQWKY
jgi:hypothetical protein